MSDDGGASENHETTIQCCNAVHNSVPAIIKHTLRFPTIYNSVWGMGMGLASYHAPGAMCTLKSFVFNLPPPPSHKHWEVADQTFSTLVSAV